MIAYTRKQITRLLKIDFIRFCLVGGSGFILNLVILVLLRHFTGIPLFWAQLIAAEIALFSNFMLHHHWTYKHNDVHKSIPKLLIQFHATTWPAIIGSAFMVSLLERFLHLNDLGALIGASAVSLFWNFFWSKFVIWRGVTTKDIEEGVK